MGFFGGPRHCTGSTTRRRPQRPAGWSCFHPYPALFAIGFHTMTSGRRAHDFPSGMVNTGRHPDQHLCLPSLELGAIDIIPLRPTLPRYATESVVMRPRGCT